MTGKKCKKIYAIYKKDELLAMGTANEVAILLKIKPQTVRFYASAAQKRRAESHRECSGHRIAESFYDDE